MNVIQRGTSPMLPIKLKNLAPDVEVASVEFIFKNRESENAPAVVYKKYPDGGVVRDGEYFMVSLTEAETRMFIAKARLYMGTRIVYADGSIPRTTTVQIEVDETLFDKED